MYKGRLVPPLEMTTFVHTRPDHRLLIKGCLCLFPERSEAMGVNIDRDSLRAGAYEFLGSVTS